MKKIILFLCVCISCAASAQIITIPDVNFKFSLMYDQCVDSDGNGTFESDVDTDNDGEIQLSEALAVNTLNVLGHHISSLDGIAYFSNITRLHCNSNQLTTLDVQV